MCWTWYRDISVKSCVLCFADLAVLNKSISQRWRRLRRRCSSFTTPSTGGERLVPQTQETSMPREETTPLRTTAGEILRSKLNRLHAGLRKRRAVSVHEMSRNQPTFYVPSPLTRDNDGPASLPPYNYSKYRTLLRQQQSEYFSSTVREEQLETKFWRETEMYLPSLSLLWCWRHWCYPLLHFCKRDSGGLFHCGVTTNFIFIITIHISMGGSPSNVSEEPVT